MLYFTKLQAIDFLRLGDPKISKKEAIKIYEEDYLPKFLKFMEEQAKRDALCAKQNQEFISRFLDNMKDLRDNEAKDD